MTRLTVSEVIRCSRDILMEHTGHGPQINYQSRANKNRRPNHQRPNIDAIFPEIGNSPTNSEQNEVLSLLADGRDQNIPVTNAPEIEDIDENLENDLIRELDLPENLTNTVIVANLQHTISDSVPEQYVDTNNRESPNDHLQTELSLSTSQ